MMQHHPSGSWLRTLCGVFAAVAVMTLAACGGGSGAPNNPYAPVIVPAQLLILPAAPTIYSQVSTTLTISGGVPPYRAFSNNSAVLPVTQNLPGNTLTLLAGTVSALTATTVTIQDASGAAASVNVTILPGPPSPPSTITILPNPVDVFPAISTLLTISGGVPPYHAFSSNTAVLPVAANVTGNTLALLANAVNADTAVTVTIQDSVSQSATVNVTVHPKASAASPLVVLPSAVTTAKQAPATVAISGGLPPYKAYSSNPGLLPVTQNVVGSSIVLAPAADATNNSNVSVAVTVQDSAGQAAVIAVTVGPSVTTPPPLAVLPSAATAFSGVPSVLTVTGGVPPYTAVSSNPAVLPVTQAVAGSSIPLLPASVAAATAVTVTVQDSTTATASATVTVNPAALVNNLTITPNSADCGTQAICSGQTGTASVSVQAPGGGPAAGRQIRFDVVAGPYAIVSGASTVPSAVVTSDSAGNAQVIIRANVDAPTQPAQIRVTDIASGQQITGSFIIQQLTNGSSILTVVPSEANITGPFVGICSSDVHVLYFIYGGTPPYRVTATFPQGVDLLNSTVLQSGGYFEAVTNGSCVKPLVFSIVDATGRQTTATLNNVQGTADAPVIPVPDLAVMPGSYTDAACTGKTFPFIVSGGTPPYNVSATKGTVTPPAVLNSGDTTSVSGLVTGGGVSTIVIVDSSPTQKSLTATVTCN